MEAQLLSVLSRGTDTPMLSPTGRADSALRSVSQMKSTALQLSLRPSAWATFTQLLLGDTSNSFFLITSRLRLKSSPYNQCCDSGTVTQVWADAGSHSSTSRSSDCIPNFLTGGERIWHTSEASHRTHQEQPCMGRLWLYTPWRARDGLF